MRLRRQAPVQANDRTVGTHTCGACCIVGDRSQLLTGTLPHRTLCGRASSGRGSFIDSVLTSVDDFYAEVLATLRAWSAAPPKLRPATPTPPELDDSVPAALASTDYSSQDGFEVANTTSAGERADAHPAAEKS